MTFFCVFALNTLCVLSVCCVFSCSKVTPKTLFNFLNYFLYLFFWLSQCKSQCKLQLPVFITAFFYQLFGYPKANVRPLTRRQSLITVSESLGCILFDLKITGNLLMRLGLKAQPSASSDNETGIALIQT